MLCYNDTTIADYNSVYSADCTDAASRPSLTISYTPATSEINVLVNATRQLPLPDSEETLTWTSGNPAIVTVNSSGVITGVMAGETTVTVSSGGTELASYRVYVKIADGVYYIKNVSLGKYLKTTGGIAENTLTTLGEKQTQGLDQLIQLWRIQYMSSGYYNIRPMYRLTMGLQTTSGLANIKTAGVSDNLTGVSANFCWKIEGNSGNYKLLHTGSSALALKATGSTGGYATISTGVYSASNNAYLWNLEGPNTVDNQVLLLDTSTGESVAGTEIYLDPGESKTIAQLNWTTSVVCAYNLDQMVTWYSSDSSIRVDSTTGTITAMTPGGTASISPKHFFAGTPIGPSCTANVKPIPDGTYYLRSQIYNRYLQIDNDDASNNYATSGTIMEQWEYDGGEYQKWLLQWRGDGYYSIISAKSGKALTVPSGQTESADISLVQQPYTGNDRQLWKITITEDHYYKIKAKSSEGASDDLVMAVGYSVINDSNGVNIEQRVYLNHDDTYYNHFDKWFICSFVDVGMSTDNYTDAPNERERQSYFYATTFWDGLNDGNPFFCEHNYNKDSIYLASKADFSQNGAMSNNTDFMIFIGHGHSAGKCSNNAKGNHIQYCYATGGEVEKNDVCSLNLDNVDDYCLYTDEVRFGSSESDLRWVWMYTCNFLNANSVVSDDDLKEMMTGAHILMGYGTQSKLCEPNVEKFAKHLRNGETIIDAFFWAGQFGEATCTTDNHLQRVMYIPQAEFETIYSPQIHYDYEPEDVIIRQRFIKDGVTYEN